MVEQRRCFFITSMSREGRTYLTVNSVAMKIIEKPNTKGPHSEHDENDCDNEQLHCFLPQHVVVSDADP